MLALGRARRTSRVHRADTRKSSQSIWVSDRRVLNITNLNQYYGGLATAPVRDWA
jgi:hypothetical protein